MDAASPDAARDRPASLGGQYDKLLATVGNLQGDLQRTVGVCQVQLTLIARVVHQPMHYSCTIIRVYCSLGFSKMFGKRYGHL